MTVAGAKAWSLRGRLSRNMVLVVSLGWFVTILVTALLINHEFNEMLDEELRALGDETALLLDSSEGARLARSISVSGEGDERVLRITPLGFAPPPAPWGVVGADGYADSSGWRVLRMTAENATIEVGHNKAWRREEVVEASLGLLVLVLPLVAVILLAVRRTVGLSLAPARDLAKRVAERGPEDFTPVSAKGLPAELLPLVTSLNAYTDRVSHLREAERAFVANAAHELRTPIAALRARLEVEDPKTAAAVQPVLDRLARRIERLLQLARSEAGGVLGQGPSDLLRILRLIRDEMPAAQAARLVIDDHDQETLDLPVDPDALAILLRNIIDNACENSTGLVRVSVWPEGKVVVENPVAPGAAFQEARFASGVGSTGAGLGLAIMAAVSQAIGAGLRKEMVAGDGGRRARVEVDFMPLLARKAASGGGATG